MLRFKGYSEWQVLTCHIEMQSQYTSLPLWINQHGHTDSFPAYLSIFCICSHSKDVSTEEGQKGEIKKKKGGSQ